MERCIRRVLLCMTIMFAFCFFGSIYTGCRLDSTDFFKGTQDMLKTGMTDLMKILHIFFQQNDTEVIVFPELAYKIGHFLWDSIRDLENIFSFA